MIPCDEWQRWLFETYFARYPAAREAWAQGGFYDLDHGCVSDLALAWYDDCLAMDLPASIPTSTEMRMYREGHRLTNQGWTKTTPEEIAK